MRSLTSCLWQWLAEPQQASPALPIQPSISWLEGKQPLLHTAASAQLLQHAKQHCNASPRRSVEV